MSYTVTKLITNAYYLAGVIARRAQTVTGDQISDGLDLLNDLLGVKTANYPLIPYYQILNGTLVAGQEEYFIPNLIMVDSMTFFIGVVRYPMQEVSRRNYFGSPRVNNINSLPFSFHVERTLDGANVFLYFLPEANYTYQLVGKFGLMTLSSSQLLLDLQTIYDQYYIAYLRYALAEYIAEDYNISFPPQAAKKLQEYETMIRDISPLDLTMKKMSSMTSDGGINWGDVNIGRGWRP